MPLTIAALIFTILIVSIGIIHYRLGKRTRAVRKLEKLLADSSRELASLEILKSEFLVRIGEVLITPLKAIEASSGRLTATGSDISGKTLRDLNDLSDEVRSLIRILGIFEELSTEEDEGSTEAEVVEMDDIVSEISMNISDDAANKMISLSVAICGTVTVSGRKAQLFETVTSILRIALKLAEPGTVMTIQLQVENNMEFSVSWERKKQETSEDQDLLGVGFIRLVASSHGGWLSEDIANGNITLILPIAGEN